MRMRSTFVGPGPSESTDEFRLMIPDYEGYRVQIYQKDVIELDRTQFAPPLRNPTLEVT